MHIPSLRPIAMVFAVGLVMVHLVVRRMREKRAKRRAEARKASRALAVAKRGTGRKGATPEPPGRATTQEN